MPKRSIPRKQASPIVGALGFGLGAPGVGPALLRGLTTPEAKQRAAQHERNLKEAEQTRKRLSRRSRG